MTDDRFVVTDEWLDRFRPGPGSSWTQAMLELLDPDAWPNTRRSPVSGWRDRLRGRVITDAQRTAFEAKVREAIQADIAYHTARLDAAQRRLAALDPSMALAGWETWRPASARVM